jgi:hypothetical protein
MQSFKLQQLQAPDPLTVSLSRFQEVSKESYKKEDGDPIAKRPTESHMDKDHSDIVSFPLS